MGDEIILPETYFLRDHKNSSEQKLEPNKSADMSE
jgi:hypothetical protein